MRVGGVRRIEVTERERPALGFGISQSGRVLRDLVHLGFNQDLAGRQVFDGILPVVAGSRRTCINWQFAQAGRYSRQHEDHSYGDDQFPFSYPTLTDPISRRSSGILQRARDAGVCPKVLRFDTESDFWQARSLSTSSSVTRSSLSLLSKHGAVLLTKHDAVTAFPMSKSGRVIGARCSRPPPSRRNTATALILLEFRAGMPQP